MVIYMVINSVRLAVGEVFSCTRSLCRLSFFVYAPSIAWRRYFVKTFLKKSLKKIHSTPVRIVVKNTTDGGIIAELWRYYIYNFL